MSVDISGWKEFRFGDLISDIYKSKSINKDDLLEVADDVNNAIRYITRTNENNGCELLADVRYIDTKKIEKGNAISIGDTTATCFYQDEDFITGDHMVIVRADNWLNPKTALYILSILNNERFKYSYGRAFLMDSIKNTILRLPATSSGEPDWEWMESYIRSLHHKPLTTSNKVGQAPELDTSVWREFLCQDLFDIKIAKSSDIGSLDDGPIKFIGRSIENNGVQGYVDVPDDKIVQPRNTITIGMVNGECKRAFYQEEPFTCSQNIALLECKSRLSVSSAHFICTILNQAMDGKFPYMRSCTKKTLNELVLKLPATPSGEPDWEWMESYIRSLPYGDRLNE